jgi:hypothetical protein
MDIREEVGILAARLAAIQDADGSISGADALDIVTDWMADYGVFIPEPANGGDWS